MTAIWKRPGDLLFFIYFLVHIPVTLIMSPQVVFGFDANGFGFLLKQSVDQTKDPILALALLPQVPAWVKGVMGAELFFQLPFFFHAIDRLLRNRKIGTIGVVYSSHALTSMIIVLAHINSVPSTQEQWLQWQSMYVAFWLVPVLFLMKILYE
jgi:hypothetical protein